MRRVKQKNIDISFSAECFEYCEEKAKGGLDRREKINRNCNLEIRKTEHGTDNTQLIKIYFARKLASSTLYLLCK